MKILFVITGLGMGGAESQVVNLSDALSSRGHSITIAYILKPMIVQPKSDQVDVIWLGGSKSVLGMIKAFRRMLGLVHRIKPDVVHSHMYHANMLSRLARFFCDVPRLVCTAHSVDEGGISRMLMYRLTDKFADEFTNVSQEAVRSFERKGAAHIGRMRVVHNGIDTNRFKFDLSARGRIRAELGIDSHKVFISIGRFHAAKDYPNLLKAFSLVCEVNDNCHLLIVGDGELRGIVEQDIKKYCLGDKVTLLGVRTDIPELLSSADVFVLSSAWEGLPLVVGEAMACERIVVSTDAGGAKEFLLDFEYLVQPRRSYQLSTSMSKALLLSDTDAALKGRMSRERIIKCFNVESVVDVWLSIYGVI
ncbi:glycosyltransferase [Marinobacter sp.]|uniref:glycosyltransferase n=1 Tax=Marinobacter sp. TaxID=50741 RepID=UPI003A957F50